VNDLIAEDPTTIIYKVINDLISPSEEGQKNVEEG
jgi:hypothetical protein